MPGAIGVNLRVTGHSSQGGRKYMEDFFSVAYQQSEDECDLEFAFFGIFDGHGGPEAAAFAKEHLMRLIVNQKQFWSDNDTDVLRAIREGYIATHKAMWREQEKWPRTATGLPSTAGTTATVAFIRHGKMYIGHVGDSGIVLGYQDPDGSLDWKSRSLTQDHKPECDIEKSRIMSCGGKVVAKSGVSRVVWTRPRLGHKGPIRRSTPIDEIPFLAVARSLGDLWSYNSQCNEFVVSPEPDVHVITIDKSFRCLVFGTDGLWNVLSANAAVDIVRNAEYMNDRNYYCSKEMLNPSRCLVNRALEKWSTTRIRADNTSVVTILLDPPGGPKRKQFAAGGAVRQSQQAPVGSYEDWHTMEEECLNSPGGSTGGRPASLSNGGGRNVEEELDLLNESLYNHSHQYHGLDSIAGGDGNNFHLLHSPSSSFGASASSSYENYMNLNAMSPQFQRLPPPGGFLQSQLQLGPSINNQSALQQMAMFVDYDQNSVNLNSSQQPGAAMEVDQIQHSASFNLNPTHQQHNSYSNQHHQQQHAMQFHPHHQMSHHHHPPPQQPPMVVRNLPTFSNLLEDTAAAASYSLTRLETRMEQLTSSVAGSSSMFANYQQLIETTSEYCPQIDLNAINTFHDYAGVPLAGGGGEGSSTGVAGGPVHSPMTSGETFNDSLALATTTTAISSATATADQLNFAMDDEKFAWSQEWHNHNLHPHQSQVQEQSQLVVVEQQAVNQQEMDNQQLFTTKGDNAEEMPTSSTNSVCLEVDKEGILSGTGGEIERELEPPREELIPNDSIISGADLQIASIQINEITSSGVVPTPPPVLQPQIFLIPEQDPFRSDPVAEIGANDGEKNEFPLEAEELTKRNSEKVDSRREQQVRKVKQPVVKEQSSQSNQENVQRRQLRCQRSPLLSTKVEKENKSQSSDNISSRGRHRTGGSSVVATNVLATTPRSTVATPVGLPPSMMTTRKSTTTTITATAAALRLGRRGKSRSASASTVAAVAAIKSALRSKQAPTLIAVKTKAATGGVVSDKSMAGAEKQQPQGKRTMLINSSKFNQLKEEKGDVKQEHEDQQQRRNLRTEVVARLLATKAATLASCGSISRRVSKRDKVRQRASATSMASSSSSSVVGSSLRSGGWRSVTKSTVQTRNRVQKR